MTSLDDGQMTSAQTRSHPYHYHTATTTSVPLNDTRAYLTMSISLHDYFYEFTVVETTHTGKITWPYCAYSYSLDVWTSRRQGKDNHHPLFARQKFLLTRDNLLLYWNSVLGPNTPILQYQRVCKFIIERIIRDFQYGEHQIAPPPRLGGGAIWYRIGVGFQYTNNNKLFVAKSYKYRTAVFGIRAETQYQYQIQ